MNAINRQFACDSYHVVIHECALDAIDLECKRGNDEIETGGVLVGFYSCSTIVVTEALAPPPDSEQSSTWFVRGKDGLADILADRWARPKRTYYIGEWHWHPTKQVSNSCVDDHAMFAISKDVNYQCSKPILVIAGYVQDNKERGLGVWIYEPDASSPLEFRECSK